MRRYALLLMMMAVTGVGAQAPLPSIQRLQASLISNFPAYVVWPSDSQQIRVGIIGPNPLGEAGTRYLEGHGYAGKSFVVQKASRSDLKNYQILIIGDVDKKQIKQILKTVSKDPVLTIGQNSDFLKMGGIINFHIQGNAVNFSVSTANAKQARIEIDPRLITYGKTL